MTDKQQALPLLELRLKRKETHRQRLDAWYAKYGEGMESLLAFYQYESDDAAFTDKFYSQPFKPELITELFEGWEEWGENERFGNMYNGDCVEYAASKHNPMLKIWPCSTKGTDAQYDFYLPATLCRFIDHCHDAGLPLYLNEETRNKYPALEY